MFLKIFVITLYLQCLPTREERIIKTLKYSKFRMKLTVVNGEPASNWQVPYLVSIKEPSVETVNKTIKQIRWTNLCGGSIINATFIVTAAHCFEADRFHYAKRPYMLRAVAGNVKTDLVHTGESGSSKSGSQWRQLKKVHIHKHFIFPHNDIALAVIDFPFEFGKCVSPVTLARTTTDFLGACVTAGYGKTGHGKRDPTSKILLLAPIDTISRSQCSLLWDMNMDEFICSNSVRSDVSEGDSGGPLTCVYSMDPAGKDGRDLLMGIVSGKNYDKTTLFTRVSMYHDWIRLVMTTGKQERSNAFNTVVDSMQLILNCLFFIFTYFFVI